MFSQSLLAKVTGLALLLCAMSANATDYYAAPNAPPSGACTDPAAPCDLAYVLGYSGGTDVRIHLAAGSYTPYYQPSLGSATLIGAGSATTSIYSGSLSCVFTISNATVTITDLMISRGMATGHSGICIDVPDGSTTSLSLVRTLVEVGNDDQIGVSVNTTGSGTANVSMLDSYIYQNGGGGLVFNGTGTVTIDRSLFYRNGRLSSSSSAAPGGLQIQGTVTATITNSTFTQNANNASSPNANGGGIADFSSSLLRLNNVTVAGNSTTGSGSEIYAINASIDHSIVAGTCAGGTLGGSYSIESPGNTCSLSATSYPNISAGLLNLGPLADNGGPTQTMMPLAGSVAIGIGGIGCETVDQRDDPRNGACDSGAVQANGDFIFKNGFE